MSQHVEVPLGEVSLDQLADALEQLGLQVERGEHERIMLPGGIECADQPVDARVQPGPFGTIEPFGLLLENGRATLVCGDVDRRRLQKELVPELQARLWTDRVVRAAQQAGLEVEPRADVRGRRRLVLKRRDD